jgi:hypothetical protein
MLVEITLELNQLNNVCRRPAQSFHEAARGGTGGWVGTHTACIGGVDAGEFWCGKRDIEGLSHQNTKMANFRWPSQATKN